ncbi:MAG: hypothetical protein ACYDH4_10650 [Candidatus Cryosericum sp.]
MLAVILPVAILLWRMSAITTTLRITLEAVQKEVALLRDGLANIAKIPDLERRVAQVEGNFVALTNFGSRVAVLESQVQSIKSMRRVGSSPRIDPRLDENEE